MADDVVTQLLPHQSMEIPPRTRSVSVTNDSNEDAQVEARQGPLRSSYTIHAGKTGKIPVDRSGAVLTNVSEVTLTVAY